MAMNKLFTYALLLLSAGNAIEQQQGSIIKVDLKHKAASDVHVTRSSEETLLQVDEQNYSYLRTIQN